MSLLYQIAYVIGLKPWDTGHSPAELVSVVEGDHALTPGRALDLGCGTGTNALYLSRHGWDTTGVDNVRRALATAQRKAFQAGLEPRLVKGDVTRLSELGIGDGYNLLLDVGCYHSLAKTRCDAYAEGVTAVASRGATFLLYGFLPGVLPKKVGVTAEELRARFQDWELMRATPSKNWLPTTAFELRRR